MIKKSIIILTILVFLGSCSEKEKIIDKPNFIFILADDLGYGELGIFRQILLH